MTKEKIFEAIGDIDEKYLEESENYRTKMKRAWTGTLVACLAVIIGLGASLPFLKDISFPFSSSTTLPTLIPPQKTYTVLETDMSSDSNIGANHRAELKIKTAEIEDISKKGSTGKIKINGVSFNGTYKNTTQSPYFNCSFEKYKGTSEGVQVQFNLNSETNDILGFSVYDPEYLLKKGDKNELTKEECTNIAWDYLKQYVSDIENYKITYNEFVEMDAYKGMYRIRFYRYLDEIMTLDCAFINVTIYGDIIRFSRHNLGGMKNVDILKNHNIENIEKSVDNKRTEIYGELESNPNYDIKFRNDKMLIRLADGKYALEYTIYASITNTKTEITSADTSSLLVYLE